MKQIVNEAYKPIFIKIHGITYIILMGGRGAGRSHVASQYANAKLVAPEYFRCAIMRLVLGDIRNSIYKEIKDRAEENGITSQIDINDSLMTISYGANSINAVGFKKSSGDQTSKLKSLANYTDVIIEEADEISEEDFMQLDDSLRTIKGEITVILLLNPPPKNHWIIKRWFKLIPSPYKGFYIPELQPEIKDTLVIRTNYKDNIKNIAERSVQNYEAYKERKPEHYYNMVLGLVPETVVGKIYNNWREIPSVPFEAKLIGRGLDFGYTNHPSALVSVYKYNGGYIWDEELYRPGLSNVLIAQTINNLPEPDALVIADSAEPKSIAEIKLNDVNILPCTKGAGSINTGIAFVIAQKISYTARSKNIKTEYENYAWVVDKKTGETLNIPVDAYNHAMDAGRYIMTSVLSPEEYQSKLTVTYH